MKYRSEIDGLRAIAVIPVIFFHAGFELFSGGFVGVDVFFVISGYLITTIILIEKEAGKFKLVDFYNRRARRILPALFFIIAFTTPFSFIYLYANDFQSFAKSIISTSTFTSNIFFWLESSYFDVGAEYKPLLHTWSLAVEEQFYVLFPLVIMLFYQYGNKSLLIILGSLFLLSLVFSQFASLYSPTFNFYMLPTRGWELLIGSFVAFYLQKNHTQIKGNQVLSLIGLLLITYSIFEFDKQTPFPSLYALIPTIGTALILLYSSTNTITYQLLGNKFLVSIGLLSYSAYLWHQPIFALTRHAIPEDISILTYIFLIIIILGLSFLTYKFIEKPFRKNKASTPKVLITAAIASLSFTLFGYFLIGIKSEDRMSENEKKLYSYSSYPFSEKAKSGRCFLEKSSQSFIDFSIDCEKIPLRENNSIFLWGDSHAAAISIGLRDMHSNTAQFNISSCPPLIGLDIPKLPFCSSSNNSILKKMSELQPSTVILAAYWDFYGKNKREYLQNTILQIQKNSPRSKIIIVGNVPIWPKRLYWYLIKKKAYLTDERDLKLPYYDKLKKVDKELSTTAHNNGAEFFSAINVFCKADGSCKAITKFKKNYSLTAYDYGHLTEAGSRLLAIDLLKQIGNDKNEMIKKINKSYPKKTAKS